MTDKPRIFVLDDDEDITLLARSVLMMHGYEVVECNDPVQGLEIVADASFDLILADIMMPEMDGISFIGKAKETGSNEAARYAVLTAKKLSEEDRRTIFDLGAEIMTKPFVPIHLVERVAELLR